RRFAPTQLPPAPPATADMTVTVDTAGAEAAGERSPSAIDPVCGMHVDPTTALSAEVDGVAYWFCSIGCRDIFLAAQPAGTDTRR
ncbi:MAG: YHS domain-containing protein, partial [Acidimicrobiales bacterium]